MAAETISQPRKGAHVYACALVCRQAVKLMKLNAASPTSSPYLPVHSSLAATAAWRYAQLLAALPKRDTEASSWMQFAQGQLPKGVVADAILGPANVLKGEQDNSKGVVVDLQLLRALPCW